jgi:hypothetical protein
VRCPRCGNENPETNRFCGMCGATLLQAGQTPTTATPSATSQPTAVRPASSGTASPTATRSAAPAPPTREEAPMVSGPSFLGLNQPATSQSPRAGTGNRLSIDPNAPTSSRNLNYLLEDDEPRRGGAGKYVLILIALALAGGLGYLRWRNQGFGWLKSIAEKPPAATQSSDNGNSGSSSPATNNNASPAPNPATAPSGNAASSGGASNAPGTPNPTVPAPATSLPTSPNQAQTPNANTSGTPTSPSGNSASTEPSSQSSTSQPSSTSQSSLPQPSSPPSSTQPAASTHADSAEGASATSDQTTAAEDQAKPSAIKPVKPVDVVAEAQKYLYGKGVPQSCDRGLRILKPAAEHSNAKAMIEMGALYSAGLCTPRDLPTAYRWFAMALRKEPGNQDVQTDLEKLWGEMTQPERQLAIKLSQ